MKSKNMIIVSLMIIVSTLVGCATIASGDYVDINSVQSFMDSAFTINEQSGYHIKVTVVKTGNTDSLANMLGVYGMITYPNQYLSNFAGIDYDNYTVEIDNNGKGKVGYKLYEYSGLPYYLEYKNNRIYANIDLFDNSIESEKDKLLYNHLKEFDFRFTGQPEICYGSMRFDESAIPYIKLPSISLAGVYRNSNVKALKVQVEKLEGKEGNEVPTTYYKYVAPANKMLLKALVKEHEIANGSDKSKADKVAREWVDNLTEFKVEYFMYGSTQTVEFIITSTTGNIMYRYDISDSNGAFMDYDLMELASLDIGNISSNIQLWGAVLNELEIRDEYKTNQSEIKEVREIYERLLEGSDKLSDFLLDSVGGKHEFPMLVSELIALDSYEPGLSTSDLRKYLPSGKSVDMQRKSGENIVIYHIKNMEDKQNMVYDCYIEYILGKLESGRSAQLALDIEE